MYPCISRIDDFFSEGMDFHWKIKKWNPKMEKNGSDDFPDFNFWCFFGSIFIFQGCRFHVGAIYCRCASFRYYSDPEDVAAFVQVGHLFGFDR